MMMHYVKAAGRAALKVAGPCLVVAVMAGVANARTGTDGDAPEIGTASLASAVALLSFGAMMLRSRFRSKH